MNTKIRICLYFIIFGLLSSVANSATIKELDDDTYKKMYNTMMIDTYKLPNNSPFAGMGGAPDPYVLIYSTAEQKFVSDIKKFELLELKTADKKQLTDPPKVIKNHPVNHHYFDSLPFKELQQYLPDANINSEYIVFMSLPTHEAAVITETLLKKLRKKQKTYIKVPQLVEHIHQVLERKNWQVYRRISEN